MWDHSPATRDWTCIFCIGRQILNHWTAREVLTVYLVTLVPSIPWNICWDIQKSVLLKICKRWDCLQDLSLERMDFFFSQITDQRQRGGAWEASKGECPFLSFLPKKKTPGQTEQAGPRKCRSPGATQALGLWDWVCFDILRSKKLKVLLFKTSCILNSFLIFLL